MTFEEIRLLFLRRRQDASLQHAPPEDAYSNVRSLSAFSYAKRQESHRTSVLCASFRARVERLNRA
jgi:hypothetical protein